MGDKLKQGFYRLVVALFCVCLISCAVNPVSGKYDFVMLSEDSEISIGRTNHPKIIAQYGRYDNEILQAYVQSVGERLAAASHRKELVYRFTVLDSPVINAFALPGGYVYITRGLMAYLNSEAELAAVLGHEIGHVTARHGVQQQSASQIANLGYTVASVLVPELGSAPSQQLFNILGGALLSGYGRTHELEADGLGAEYLARSGYEPQAMLDVLRVLKAQEVFAAAEAKKQGRKSKGGYHGLFASHPDNDTRLQQVISSADQYIHMKNGKIGRTAYFQHINDMIFGKNEKQGIHSGRHFYHKDMGFALDFPIDWHIENTPNGLQVIAPEGQAIIKMEATDLHRKKLLPQDFIKQRLGIKQLKSPQKLNPHGLEGYSGLIDKQGKPVRVAVVFLKDRAFIFFAGVKEPKLFSHFDDSFIEIVNSFHVLKTEEFDLATALKLEIVIVSLQDSYSAWAEQTRIGNSPIDQLRLLNGDYPDKELKVGKQAKRVK